MGALSALTGSVDRASIDGCDDCERRGIGSGAVNRLGAGDAVEVVAVPDGEADDDVGTAGDIDEDGALELHGLEGCPGGAQGVDGDAGDEFDIGCMAVDLVGDADEALVAGGDDDAAAEVVADGTKVDVLETGSAGRGEEHDRGGRGSARRGTRRFACSTESIIVLLVRSVAAVAPVHARSEGAGCGFAAAAGGETGVSRAGTDFVANVAIWRTGRLRARQIARVGSSSASVPVRAVGSVPRNIGRRGSDSDCSGIEIDAEASFQGRHDVAGDLPVAGPLVGDDVDFREAAYGDVGDTDEASKERLGIPKGGTGIVPTFRIDHGSHGDEECNPGAGRSVMTGGTTRRRSRCGLGRGLRESARNPAVRHPSRNGPKHEGRSRGKSRKETRSVLWWIRLRVAAFWT